MDNLMMGKLLKYCSENPELYNKISNYLHQEFEIQSAEITLLITYVVGEYERGKDGKEDI